MSRNSRESLEKVFVPAIPMGLTKFTAFVDAFHQPISVDLQRRELQAEAI
jgi:hypothetical protein